MLECLVTRYPNVPFHDKLFVPIVCISRHVVLIPVYPVVSWTSPDSANR